MPAIRLNKAQIDKLPYSERKQKIYCDDTLKGFYLLVSARTKTYIVQRDIQNKTVRYTIGKHGVFTPDKARKIAQEKLMLMSQGLNPKKLEEQDKYEQTTLQELLDNYLLVRRNLKDSTQREYRYSTEKYLSDWLNKPVAEIDKKMVIDRHTYVSKKNGHYIANGLMRILRTLLNHANTTYDICEINPVNYLTKAKVWNKESRRQRYIKSHQLKEWWDSVERLENDTMRDFLKFLLFTGLRRNEAATLRWRNIDFEDKTFSILETKNGDILTLPLSDSLLDILNYRKDKYPTTDYVFHGKGQAGHIIEPRKAINAIYKETGIEFTCHDLRRTFITIAESLDIPHYALKKLVNHKMDDVTSGYIVSGAERLREPVKKIEKYIKEKVSC